MVAFKKTFGRTLILAFMTISVTSAFSVPSGNSKRTMHTELSMGLISDLQLIFSEEGRKNRAAADAKARAEEEEAFRRVLERRRNPKLMAEYEETRAKERQTLNEERELWNFQQSTDYVDPKDEWDRLRKEGKIKVGSDLERDPSSSRLGSEGLVDVRIDERMPYIDQGYVDESADVAGNFMKMFGWKKDDKESQE